MPFQSLPIADLRGGRNGTEAPLSLRDSECCEALNVDFYGAPLGRTRGGADADVMTFSAGGPFTGVISSLSRHVPGTDETAAELWAVDSALVVGRKAASTQYTAPTLKDALTGNGWDVSTASLDGKLFVAYQSAQPRLHVWDQSTVRRSGLATPAAPTVANSGGAGTYPATTLYLRVRWLAQSSGVTIRRSEPSPSTTFTPDGAHASVTVTQPTVAGEGETHWEIEGSTDNVTFYVIYGDNHGVGFSASVPIGTTSQSFSALPSLLSTSGLSELTGTYTPQKAYRFLAADQNRLLGFGSYTATDKQNRIEISAVVGSLNIGDAERVNTAASSFIDLDENSSGVPTGLVGPFNGKFLAFKYREVWQLTPSGLTANPYTQLALSKKIGCVGPKAAVIAEDETGRPAIYWLSHRGPYRFGANGLEYLGHGVEDLISRGAPNAISVMNLAATHVVAHAVYHADLRQVWFWFATGTSNDPDTKIVFSIGRVQGPSESDRAVASGWVRHTGPTANARCAVMFSRVPGASMSLDLKPFVGLATANNSTLIADSTTQTDAGTPFQSYVQTKAYSPWGFGNNGTLGPSNVLAKASDGTTVTQTLTADFGTETQTSTIDLTPAGSETRVLRKCEDAGLQGVSVCQLQWGDAAAAASTWALEAAEIDWMGEDNR